MGVETETGARHRASDVAALRHLWWRWTEVVERFARRRRGRRRVAAPDYVRLHAELLAACRSLARAADGGRREFYTGLLELAQPWVSLHSLEHGDPEILLGVCLRCHAAQRKLGGRPWRSRVRGCAGPAFALLLLAAGAFLGVQTSDRVFFPLLAWLKDWIIVVRFSITRFGQMPLLLVLGAAVMVLAVYLVSRATRV